jgi:hypothetical protein
MAISIHSLRTEPETRGLKLNKHTVACRKLLNKLAVFNKGYFFISIDRLYLSL